MKCTWIYTGEDGRSHFEDLDIPLNPVNYGTNSAPIAATNVVFRETPVGGALDYHPAPRRQFVVNLSGLVEIECGDGSKRRMGAGDVLLADDTSGQGHITRDLEGPRRSIFIFLSPDLDPAQWRVQR
ncbi:MAG TPA: hypothetical protein VFC51_03675 [Chloroflexota bacterium]|nr:hypothetical protein [Chloroflexota bacterium]